MIRKVLCLLGVAGFVALAACGGDDESGPTYGSLDSFCEAKAKASCPGIVSLCVIAQETCERVGKSSCMSQYGSKTYKAGAADACISKVEDVFKSAPTYDGEKEVDTVCGRVFGGNVPKEGPCTKDYDCVGDLICGSKGFCGEATERSIGEGCNNSGDTCPEDAYCAPGDNRICQKRKALAELCSDKEPCQQDLRCGGTCKNKNDPNTPCDVDNDCGKIAPYCEPTQKKCLPKYQQGSAACRLYGGV